MLLGQCIHNENGDRRSCLRGHLDAGFITSNSRKHEDRPYAQRTEGLKREDDERFDNAIVCDAAAADAVEATEDEGCKACTATLKSSP